MFQQKAVQDYSYGRIENIINWNLSRITSIASLAQKKQSFKQSLIESLEKSQLHRLGSIFTLFSDNESPRQFEFGIGVKRSRIEDSNLFEIRGWIACNKSISEGGTIPIFVLEHGGNKFQTKPILKERIDVKNAIGLPSYEFIIDLTPLLPSFRELTHDLLKTIPKKAKLIIKSSLQDIVQDINLECNFIQPERKKTILFATHDLRNAGAQNSLLQLAERLVALHDYKVHVVSPSEGPMRQEYESEKIEFSINKDFSFATTSESTFFKKLYSQVIFLKTINPALVVANTFHTSLTALAASSLEIPTVLIPRESENPFDLFKDQAKAVQKYFVSTPLLADRCIFVSKYTREKWISSKSQELKNKHMVINNGLNISKLFMKTMNLTGMDSRKTLGIPENATVLLTVGTVTERKGQFNTIRSFVEFVSSSQTDLFYLIIVGLEENIYSRSIKDYLNELPSTIRGFIKIFEATNSPSDNLCATAYKASDIFIMSSQLESYPRVVLEAISYGLAIISTRCFGVKEMLEKSEAIFYDNVDTSELSGILLKLLVNPELIGNMKEKSSQAFKRLESVESMSHKYLKTFQSLLEK
ncbi:glycosyltransferase family 4 protein [Synechococcus sp. AH-603-M21]|nr:glycosyltransferase family 4 protein [Synechococcus sp. AH-603-M21]